MAEIMMTGVEHVAPEDWARCAAGCLRRIIQRKGSADRPSGLVLTPYQTDELIDAITANIWHLYRALPYRVPIDCRYIYSVARQVLAYWLAKRREEREAVACWAVGVEGDGEGQEWDGANGRDAPDSVTELDRLLCRVQNLNDRCHVWE